MAKVALVETKPSRTDYRKEFEGAFDFDQNQHSSDPTNKKEIKRGLRHDYPRMPVGGLEPSQSVKIFLAFQFGGLHIVASRMNRDAA